MIIPTQQNPASGTTKDGAPIRCGSFWPEIDPVAARVAMRLDGTVTAERLRGALIEAAATVNGELAEWRRTQQDSGFGTLVSVPAEEIDEQSINAHRWLRAVQCTAAANLNERYSSFDSTSEGKKKGHELASASDDLRRDSRWAICDIIGRGRSTIELI